ncbi:ras-related protein Rab-32 isoform X4 [Nasonia vitripennis]|uniref:Ras-related protein Rab n=1 Tax=Nasonia vitripennis TaxID=7425 RepID=A0A7M7QBY5_NASVI|nr:ras-related protein Rab-32 isoform X4 [Nasonia vitripennis]
MTLKKIPHQHVHAAARHESRATKERWITLEGKTVEAVESMSRFFPYIGLGLMLHLESSFIFNGNLQMTSEVLPFIATGQERFGNMTRVYYKEAVGAFIVFDVTRSATFDAVVKWKQDLDSKVQLSDGSPIPCVLLANKCDQQKEGIVNLPIKMDDYCKEKNFAAWFETSAKENINIEEAAKFLVHKILQNDNIKDNSIDEHYDGIKLSLNQSPDRLKKICYC